MWRPLGTLRRGPGLRDIAQAGSCAGSVVLMPLAPRTARAVDLAIGERTEGPLFLKPRRNPTARPARRVPSGATVGETSRHRQAGRAPLAAALVHHRRTRGRRGAARRPRSSVACRSENDHALRPSAPIPRPARHLRRSHLRRRRLTLSDMGAVRQPRRAAPTHSACRFGAAGSGRVLRFGVVICALPSDIGISGGAAIVGVRPAAGRARITWSRAISADRPQRDRCRPIASPRRWRPVKGAHGEGNTTHSIDRCDRVAGGRPAGSAPGHGDGRGG